VNDDRYVGGVVVLTNYYQVKKLPPHWPPRTRAGGVGASLAASIQYTVTAPSLHQGKVSEIRRSGRVRFTARAQNHPGKDDKQQISHSKKNNAFDRLLSLVPPTDSAPAPRN